MGSEAGGSCKPAGIKVAKEQRSLGESAPTYPLSPLGRITAQRSACPRTHQPATYHSRPHPTGCVLMDQMCSTRTTVLPISPTSGGTRSHHHGVQKQPIGATPETSEVGILGKRDHATCIHYLLANEHRPTKPLQRLLPCMTR